MLLKLLKFTGALLAVVLLVAVLAVWGIKFRNIGSCRYLIRANDRSYSTDTYVKDANGCLHFTEPGLGLKHLVCGNYTISEER